MRTRKEGRSVGIFVEPANLGCPIGKADLAVVWQCFFFFPDLNLT